MNNSEYCIAIIGMAGRFPMADNVHEFWENLKNGRNCITRDKNNDTPLFCSAYGRLDDVDGFDADFFGVAGSEAADTDPEQRIMTELTYHALESAGCVNSEYDGRTGLYISFDNGAYVWNNIMHTGGDWFQNYELYKAYLGARCEKIAYQFDFRGPAIISEYACASSINSVHQACQALLNYECDMAVAGGITAEPEQKGYPSHLATESSKGEIRPFDRDADGLVPGSAAGLIVLKRYDDAVKEKDNIIAVIRGTFVNNDGRRKAGFAAPSVFGQQDCLENVLEVSDVQAEDIVYYEAHGTATELGDSIELRAIKNVMSDRKEPLYIGSVKSNIGHTNMAAGISNIIKIAMILHERTLVPSINYENPCSELQESDCPVKVSTELKKYNGADVMTAVCSAVGMGGANAMAVMSEYEEAPERKPLPESLSQLFVFSAKTKTAAAKMADDAEKYIASNNVRLDDAAYTLQTAREKYDMRGFAVVKGDRKYLLKRTAVKYDKNDKRRNVFLFSGVSSFEKTVGKELYESDPVFRKNIDQCFDICEKEGITGVREAYLSFVEDSRKKFADNVKGIQILFALGYSLAMTFIEYGIKADAVIGHSNGEYIAAAVSGIISVEDAVRMLKFRSELIEKLPEGGMLNVADKIDKVRGLMTEGVTIGAINAPSRLMLSGKKEAIEKTARILEENNVVFSRISANRAGHCSLMKGIAEEYLDFLKTVTFRQPSIPIYSSCIADGNDNSSEMSDPEYWIKQMVEPVMFMDAVKNINEHSESLFIEMGSSDSLTSIVRKIKTDKGMVPAYAAFDSPTADNSRDGLLACLGDLWCRGIDIRWNMLYETDPKKTDFILYPFEHKSFWKYRSDTINEKEKSNLELSGMRPLIYNGVCREQLANTGFILENNGGKAILAESDPEKYLSFSGISGMINDPDPVINDIEKRYFTDTDTVLVENIPGYIDAANLLSCACIMDYFRSFEEFDLNNVYTLEKLTAMTGTIEKYIPFLDHLVEVLTQNGYAEKEYGMIRFTKHAAQIPEKAEVLADCIDRFPDCCAYMELCAYASDHYKEAFNGSIEGSTVIYHDGKYDFINSYDERMPSYSFTPHCLSALSDLAAEAAKRAGRKVRILEIGAGSGGLTKNLLDKISSVEYEYYFTDIKRSLVADREQADIEAGRKNMKYGVLDISRSPEQQGFTERTFDIILLFDVIQATSDIENTIKNISYMLADGGMFAFVQTCGGSELLNMIYGYAPGWWNYYGDPMRKSITMSPEQWRDILNKTGYSSVKSFPQDGTSNTYVFMMTSQNEAAEKDNYLCNKEKNTNYLLLKERYPDIELVFTDDDSEEGLKKLSEKYGCNMVVMPAGDINSVAKRDTSVLNDRNAELISIVSDVIGAEVDMDDDLYVRGMDSLMAMMISSRVQTNMGLNLQLSDMYKLKTVREISEFLDKADPSEAPEETIEISEAEKSIEDLFDELD